MNIDVRKLVDSARQALDADCAVKVAELLLDSTTRLSGDRPERVTVGHELPTWEARYKNSIRIGKHVFGLKQLLKGLQKMERSDEIFAYRLMSSTMAGNVYVDIGDNVIGAAIVDMPDRSDVSLDPGS